MQEIVGFGVEEIYGRHAVARAGGATEIGCDKIIHYQVHFLPKTKKNVQNLSTHISFYLTPVLARN